MNNSFVFASVAFLMAVQAAGAGEINKDDAYQPPIDPAKFRTVVDNPFFPLVPGTTFNYVEIKGKWTNANEVTVMQGTKVVMGVRCTIVRDVVRWGDAIREDTFDWYAQDEQGNVWYFGEETKEYESDGTVNTDGSWEGGVNGAMPGVIMPASPAPGEPYRQEYSHDAMDMGQVVAVNESVTVPFGSYAGCVKTKDWSLLENGQENKWYAKGVGFIRAEADDGEIVMLISVTGP
jgi:hypothetical protein